MSSNSKLGKGMTPHFYYQFLSIIILMKIEKIYKYNTSISYLLNLFNLLTYLFIYLLTYLPNLLINVHSYLLV